MRRIDWERFLRSTVTVRNEGGSRAFETGLRTFDCPLCGDTKARGWLGVTRHAAGCFNPGCAAEPQLDGGAIEWARRVLKLGSRAETWRALSDEFGTDAAPAPVAVDQRGDDWCRLPLGARPFSYLEPSLLQDAFARFVRSQWGLEVQGAVYWRLHWSVTGRHPWRVIIPVMAGGRAIAFQSRVIRNGVEPKYLTSQHGPAHDPQAECGRPASALLFNIDAVRTNQEALMVEGAGDVMGWRAHHPQASEALPAFAILGLALTPAKLHMIKTARPRRVIVAPDQGTRERARALDHIDDLRAWGVDAALGEWVGAKDAGAGAHLTVPDEAQDLASAMRARLRGR
jgi:hypothetical protein